MARPDMETALLDDLIEALRLVRDQRFAVGRKVTG